jgi:hypothetical protein
MWQAPDGRTGERRAALVVGVIAMVGLSGTGVALGQSDDPATDGAATTTTSGVRAGWTLHTSDAPAFSIQLPTGWTLDPATDGLLGATGPDGETLVLRLDESATGESLDAFTKASWRSVEKDIEALLSDGRNIAGGTPSQPVYRQAAGGTVARVGLARSADLGEVGDDSHVTARFLMAPCEDGARTLEISGPAPAAVPDGGPDAWDSIAASISPCSSEPMPELMLGPEVDALRAAYFARAQDINPRVLAAANELLGGGTFKEWAKDARSVAAVYDELVEANTELPWTAETLPLSEALVAKLREISAFFRTKMAKAKSNKQIDKLIKQWERLDASLLEVSTPVRFALGLPAGVFSLEVD